MVIIKQRSEVVNPFWKLEMLWLVKIALRKVLNSSRSCLSQKASWLTTIILCTKEVISFDGKRGGNAVIHRPHNEDFFCLLSHRGK